MKLPLKFENNMRKLLGNEYKAFMDSFDQKNIRGIRRNSLKVSEEELMKKISYLEDRVPW